MANSQGVLKESIWRDKDFRALPRTAQATYAQLISQKELDRAGVQPLMVSKWVKGCDEITEDDFWRDLEVLRQRRFVFFDLDTHELFIRSYMRACEVVRYPNILKNALRCAGLVASEELRFELAQELRRLKRADASRVADEIEPEEFRDDLIAFENGSETVSSTVREPLNRSETPPEPPGTGTGTGIGSVSPLVTSGGNAHASATAEEPPTPHCPKHPGGTPEPCGACADRRKAWVANHLERDRRAAAKEAELAEAERQRKLQAAEDRAREIANCDMCDAEGYAGMSLCDHDPGAVERDRRGLARAKAAACRRCDADGFLADGSVCDHRPPGKASAPTQPVSWPSEPASPQQSAPVINSDTSEPTHA